MRLCDDSVQTVMESFQLEGTADAEVGTLPIIATSFGTLCGSGDTSDKFVSLLFETNPLKHCSDTRIVMTARPLEVIYDAVSVLPLQLLICCLWYSSKVFVCWIHWVWKTILCLTLTCQSLCLEEWRAIMLDTVCDHLLLHDCNDQVWLFCRLFGC